MGVKWTDEQQKVIDLRNRNILVSAAAGSGKTAVLVERIITMLTSEVNPVDVDKLLIVTFTEAAAAEMKERIRNAIEKKLEEHPDNEHLMQQAMLIHSAQITTIHSFCLSVIRDHFHAIDIDPGFRVGEEGELKLLRHDVLDELMEERYAEGKEAFINLSVAYGGRNDKKLLEIIQKIYDFSRSYPDASEWLDGCAKAYEVTTKEELEASIYIELVKQNTRKILCDAQQMIYEGIRICLTTDGPYEYEATLLKDMEVIEELKAAATYEQMYEHFHNVKWPRLAPNKDKSVSAVKTDLVKSIREDYKAYVKDLTSQYFYQKEEEMLFDLQACRPYMEELKALVNDFSVKFEEKKRAQNMIDFSDMEQYALRILAEKKNGMLVPTEIAREYQEQFVEIMIDEYQDSNLIQETILTSVSGIRDGRYNIFMVGDVKQSIYRFRLSRPELFMGKYDSYSLEDEKEQRIDLHKNFRSRREVLDSVNFIFRQIMIRELGGIKYDKNNALNVGASFEAGEDKETEVLVIDTGKDSGKNRFGKQSERELEAKVIAARIRELIRNHKVVDKKTGENRNVEYSDIVILTRSISGFAENFAQQLNKEGIPTHVGTREGYFSTQEVGVILSYLRVLDNRMQDIPLAAVLTSPIGKMTDQELAVIKSENKELAFHQAVSDYCVNGSDETVRAKLEKCIIQMDEFRRIVPYTPIQELLYRILDDTGYGDFVSAMPGGEQRIANLEMLIEKATAFEATSYKGLFHFVRYIEHLRKYDVDYGEANVEDEESQNVRIMTIHKSKGLEFPIVFVAGMGKGFNMQDAKSTVALHARLGVGLDAVDMEERTRCPSVIKKIIQREETLDTLGEELRVLYVAFTRAKEKLIITGTVSNLEKKLNEYSVITDREQEELPFGSLSKVSTYWDWILPAMMRVSEDIPIRVKYLTIEDIMREDIEKDIVGKLKKNILLHWDVNKVYDEETKLQLEQQFSYEYPFKHSQMMKQKFSVSELKKMAYEEEAEENGEILYEEEIVPLLPNFLKEEEELTGALRGTAYHRLLELLDFTKDYDYILLKEEIDRYCKERKMDEDMGRCIRIKDILGFLQSSSGIRMRQCAMQDKLYKEQPFVLGLPQNDEMILVQGIIDVYFEEEDGLVVLDYKTDKVWETKELVDKYLAQLEYYARALEQLTRKKVKEKIIYSFTLGEEIFL